MIFITVGTQTHNFKRLFKYVDKYSFKDEVIIQYGHNNIDTNYESFDFTSDIEKYFKQSDVIITHGGVGSIIQGLKLNKKVIVLPRLKNSNEHVDDHQLEICNKLKEENLIVLVNNYKEFKSALDNINSIKLDSFKSNTEYFNDNLLIKIEQLIKGE
ncbi:MAG: PssE/Cps14G family polysaccharide biosynthesis glycosyltransferase [Mycoplasmatales bacterium]